MLWLAILVHGICYDFFFVTGQIYIDRKASIAMRAAAQGLITFITYGLGMLLGSWISGAIVDRYTQRSADGVPAYNWHAIWLFAAVASAVVLIAFLFTFSEREVSKRQEESSPASCALEGVPL
jgi:MFS family permease